MRSFHWRKLRRLTVLTQTLMESCNASWLSLRDSNLPKKAHFGVEGARAANLVFFGRASDGVKAYESLTRSRPTDPRWWHGLARALQAADRLPEALDAESRALDLCPQDVNALSQRTMILFDLARYDDGLKDSDRALALDAHRFGLRLARAQLQFARGERRTPSRCSAPKPRTADWSSIGEP